MYSPARNLNVPEDFGFPFTPYPVQQDLMQKLFQVIDKKKIGIFESPTGTGKSLTLTCCAIKWLLEYEILVKNELNAKIEQLAGQLDELERSAAATGDWLEAQFSTIQKRGELNSLKRKQTLIAEYEKKILALQSRKQEERDKNAFKQSGKKQNLEMFLESQPDEEDLLLEENDEEYENVDDDERKGEIYKDIKIFFCSRTHTQLSQVINEIKRTPYGQFVRCVSLASRQNLCINPAVNRLPTSSQINEKCLDMQKLQSKVTLVDNDGRTQKKSRTKQASSCPFKSQNAITNLAENSLTEIQDIEDLIKTGKSLRACPYYSGRISLKDAQIVMLPYQMLLHRKTRLQTGIDIKDSVIIIDEAHNLLDAISSIYSAEITYDQLKTALDHMNTYKRKYFTRFSVKNLLKINQLIFVTKRLCKILSNNDRSPKSRIIFTHELKSEGEFFNINLFDILEFCEQSRFAQKVHGLAQRLYNEVLKQKEEECGSKNLLKKLELEKQKMKGKNNKNETAVPATEAKTIGEMAQKLISSSIRPLLGFLEALTECADDGRVLIKQDVDTTKAGMKFVLLNPGGHFREIVKDSRSIIIAGGTMQPTAEILDLIFKSCLDRVEQYFYSHVVPSNSIISLAVKKGPSGKPFLFNFTNRDNLNQLTDLGMALQNVCNIVPAGIVCFFGSYDYMDTVYAHLSKQGALAKIEAKKYIFRESRTGSGKLVDKLLADYKNAIQDPQRQGALLLSVVGGKMSEGLNFSDDLGRCVIIVGMPYPNKNSMELQEKMRYLDSTFGLGAGSEFYENLCMKAVNQCIGRSVRHIKDYASVVLLDERYGQERIRSKLPSWISNSFKVSEGFGMVQGLLAQFFRSKRDNQHSCK